MVSVKIQKLNSEAKIPKYMSLGAAGCDVCACLDETLILQPGERAAVSTGLAVAIPEGFEIQVRPRSGLAIKKGLTVVNAPGTVDSDYRGEVKILMVNLSQEPVTIEHGDRVAQWIVAPVQQIQFNQVEALDETARGVGGFGSTGVDSSSDKFSPPCG